MNSMDTAPRDMTRILLKYKVRHFRSPTTEELRRLFAPGTPLQKEHYSPHWQDVGEKWEEMFFRPRPEYAMEKNYEGGHWEPWAGSTLTHSSHHVYTPDCLGWLPLPEETNDAD